MTDGPYYEPDRRRRTRTVADLFPTQAEIADYARQLFIAHGRKEESPRDYWARAEDELLDRAAHRATRS